MLIYTPGLESDVLLFKLYQRMVASRDIFAYPEPLGQLATFMQTMQAPTELHLVGDNDGPIFAMWYEPQPLGHAIVSLWLHDSIRRSPGAVELINQSLTDAFKQWPTLIAYSGDPAITSLYQHYGLALHTPDIYIDTHAVSMLSLTRQQFQARKAA